MCVRLTRWPVDRLGRRRPALRREPLVLVETVGARQTVAAACDRAAAYGVRPGMTLAQARAQCPSLAHAPLDPTGDQRALAGLGRWLTRYTPVVSPAPPDALSELKVDARVAVAPTPGGAWAIASAGQAGHGRIVSADGLSDGWSPIRAYGREPTDANRAALRAFLSPEATRMQSVHGVTDPALVAPESFALDSALLARPGIDEIQLDLFFDYASNVALHPAFRAYLRNHRPPLLAVWGRNDPFFLPAGAEAFCRDVPNTDVRFFDTGHFALETHAAEIGGAMLEFLARAAK
jgi:pimeloyl-ACP methyl ester carboxylesterase